MKTTSFGWGALVHTGTTNPLNAFGVGIYPGTHKIYVYAWNANYATTGRVVNDGQWHSVLVTFDGNTLIVYIDGVLDGIISATSWLGGRTLNTMGNIVLLGGNPAGESTQGQLKNIKFYDYALSSPTTTPPTTKPTTKPSSSSSSPTTKPTTKPSSSSPTISTYTTNLAILGAISGCTYFQIPFSETGSILQSVSFSGVHQG